MTAAEYVTWVERMRPNEEGYGEVRLIAQSPSSPAGRLLLENLELFAKKGFSVLAVFTKVRSRGDVDHAVREFDRAFGLGKSANHLRFANLGDRRNVRELMDLGKTAAQLDAGPTTLETLGVTPVTADGQTSFARKFAFDALWAVASPLAVLRA